MAMYTKAEVRLSENFDVTEFEDKLRNELKSSDPDFDIKKVELRNKESAGSGMMTADMLIYYPEKQFVHSNAVLSMIERVSGKRIKIFTISDTRE